MHPIPSQVIWMAPHSNPICETCLLLATCFHGQNTVPCPPTHMASGHSTRMKLIKKVREVSECVMTLKLHAEHPLLKGPQAARSTAVTNRTMDWKARGGRSLTQPRNRVSGQGDQIGFYLFSLLVLAGEWKVDKDCTGCLKLSVVAIDSSFGIACLPNHNDDGHSMIDGL